MRYHSISKIKVAGVCFLALLFMLGCSPSGPKDYPIRPVPFTAVQLTDRFWRPRLETNRALTIPHVFQKCEATGRVDNFALAGGLMAGEQKGEYPFDDSDVYKIIEAASYALMQTPDHALATYVDSLITLIAAAQEEDGYIYTARTNKTERLRNWFGEARWEKLEGSHELYDAGHLFEAAAAHYHATGKRNLLDVALQCADLLDKTFGPGKLQKPPGHQVIEMGLVKLYRITGATHYLTLAKFFLEARGNASAGRKLYGEYSQDHLPVLQQTEAVGHAVRAAYMYSGMADVAALTNDAAYIKALDRLWESVAASKVYLTGGVGAQGSNEGFSGNYDLPNRSAYNETCASIANVFWNHRLFLLHGEAKYLDLMERTLYNALLSGVAMDGTHFFYPNPLASLGQHERSEWFGCACCPGNVARFLAALPGYFYAVRDDEVFVNLYAANEATLALSQQQLRIKQETDYPWNDAIRLTLHAEAQETKMTLNLRIPGWAQGRPLASNLYRYRNDEAAHVSIKVNGEAVPLKIKNGFAQIRCDWHSNDVVELELPMLVRRVVAHDSVKADVGRVALERGPLVFCAEWPDHDGGHVRNLLLPDDAVFTTEFLADRLHGVEVIKANATAYYLDQNQQLESRAQELFAIPYYAWAHRGKGEMTVWLAREEQAVQPIDVPTLASTSTVQASFGKNAQAVNDLMTPANSIDHEVPYFHWWPHKGTREWVQYDFAQPQEISSSQVYWFDDTGMGECRVPQSWRVLYAQGGAWHPVETTEAYGISKDRFNTINFATVRTKALRLEIQSQAGWAGGIHEWKVK